MKKENTSAFLRGLKVCKTLVILGIGFAGTRAHYNIFKASERAYTSGVACGTSERFIDADSGRCQALPKDYLCKPGTDSGGTCYVMNCFDWRGDTECSWGSCICKNTDCVVAGRCIDCADYDCVTSQMVKCYKINTNIWGEPEDCNLNSEGICEVEMSGTGWFSGDGEDPSGELVSGAICTDPLTVSCQIWVLNSNDDPLSKMGPRKGVNLGANLGTIRGVQSFEANFFKKPSYPLDDSCGIVNGEIQMALVYPLDKDEGYDIPPVPAAAIYAIYKLFALHPQGLGFVLSCCIPGGTLELLLRTFPCWTWLSLKIQPVAAYIKYTVIPTLMIEPLLSIKEVEGVSADRMVLSRVASYEANTVLYFYVGVHLFLLLVFTFLFACCELRVKGGHKCCAAAIEAIKAEAEKASDADVQEDPKSSDVEKAGNDTENLESDAKNADDGV